MNDLLPITTELFELYREQFDEHTFYIVSTALESGEPGHAAVEILTWAIANNTAIPGHCWESLTNFYSARTAPGSDNARRKIAAVAHAA